MWSWQPKLTKLTIESREQNDLRLLICLTVALPALSKSIGQSWGRQRGITRPFLYLLWLVWSINQDILWEYMNTDCQNRPQRSANRYRYKDNYCICPINAFHLSASGLLKIISHIHLLEAFRWGTTWSFHSPLVCRNVCPPRSWRYLESWTQSTTRSGAF